MIVLFLLLGPHIVGLYFNFLCEWLVSPWESELLEAWKSVWSFFFFYKGFWWLLNKHLAADWMNKILWSSLYPYLKKFLLCWMRAISVVWWSNTHQRPLEPCTLATRRAALWCDKTVKMVYEVSCQLLLTPLWAWPCDFLRPGATSRQDTSKGMLSLCLEPESLGAWLPSAGLPDTWLNTASWGSWLKSTDHPEATTELSQEENADASSH